MLADIRSQSKPFITCTLGVFVMDEPSSSESETQTEIPSETTPESSESSDEPSASSSSRSIISRKRRQRDRQKRYQEGRCHKVQYELSESFEKSPITGVCDACAPGLKRTIEAFKAFKNIRVQS